MVFVLFWIKFETRAVLRTQTGKYVQGLLPRNMVHLHILLLVTLKHGHQKRKFWNAVFSVFLYLYYLLKAHLCRLTQSDLFGLFR